MFYPVGGEWLIFPIVGLVFMVLMLVLVVGVGRAGAQSSPFCMWGSAPPDGRRYEDPRDRRHDDPIDILRRRFAAGELTAEQFDAMRRQLDGR